jgi:hypothetical protein
MSVHTQRADSCNGPDLTPKHLPALRREHVEVFLLDVCSTELPLSKPSIYNKIDCVVACLPIGSMAPFFSAPAVYPHKSGVCNDYPAEKDIGCRAPPSQSSLRLLKEASVEKIVVAWVWSLDIRHDRILSVLNPCSAT